MKEKIMRGRGGWTIGQLARQAGCTVETVRHYERIGLLTEPARSNGNYRLYGQEDLRRLTFIRRSRELGFSQAQIRDLLASMARPGGSCDQVSQIMQLHLENVRAKLRELQQLEVVLSAAAADCGASSGPSRCACIESLCGARRTLVDAAAGDCRGSQGCPGRPYAVHPV